MKKERTECDCGSTSLGTIEYNYNHPEHYDGASEIKCLDCGNRYGHWTDKLLKDDEDEKRYGRK